MENKYAILHIEKCKANTFALGCHISRQKIPINADPDRSHLNRHIVTPAEGNLIRAIKHRIDEGYKGDKVIRKDAVKAISIVLTGSHDAMKRIEREGMLDEWVKANQSWLESRYGRENIVALSLHMDELTPHLHAVVVPLTKDGRLTAKEVMGNREVMQNTQDNYAIRMAKFGLSRGLKGSRANHTDITQYYTAIKNAETIELDITRNIPVIDPRVRLDELKKTYIAEIIKMRQKRGVLKAISPNVMSDNKKMVNNQKKGPEIEFGL